MFGLSKNSKWAFSEDDALDDFEDYIITINKKEDKEAIEEIVMEKEEENGGAEVENAEDAEQLAINVRTLYEHRLFFILCDICIWMTMIRYAWVFISRVFKSLGSEFNFENVVIESSRSPLI